MFCKQLIVQFRSYSVGKSTVKQKLKKWIDPDLKNVSDSTLERWTRRDKLDPLKFAMIYAYPHHSYTVLGSLALVGCGSALGLTMLHDRYSQTKWVRGEIINDAMKESPSLVYFLAALMASYLALADLFRRRTLIRMYRSIGGSDKEKRYVAVYRSFLLTDVKREFSGKEINIESSKWMCTARFAGKPTQFWADYFEEPKFYNEITGMAPPPSKHKDTLEEILKKFEQPVAKEKRKATDWVDRIK